MESQEKPKHSHTSVESRLDPKSIAALKKAARAASEPGNPGELNQIRTLEALSSLVEQGFLDYFRPTIQNSPEDQNQIDYFIGYQGEEMYLQEKGSAKRPKETRQIAELEARGYIVIRSVYRNSTNNRLKPVGLIEREIKEKIIARKKILDEQNQQGS